MTPPPTNAPEAGSNGEREVLISRLRTHLWVQHDSPNDDPAIRGIPEAADALIAAGMRLFFPRKEMPDGPAPFDLHERIVYFLDCIEAEVDDVAEISTRMIVSDDIREIRAALAGFTRAPGETVPPTINRVAPGGSRPWTDTEQVRLAAQAMRDADFSTDEFDVYQAINVLAVQRDAAIARAEAAEAKLADLNRTIAEVDMGEVRATHAEADVANKRAAALADALRDVEHAVAYGDQIPTGCDLHKRIRAALAGNGNGTGGGMSDAKIHPADRRAIEALTWALDCMGMDKERATRLVQVLGNCGWWLTNCEAEDAAARAKLRGALYTIRNGAHAALVADLIDDGPPLTLPAAPPSAGETNDAR